MILCRRRSRMLQGPQRPTQVDPHLMATPLFELWKYTQRPIKRHHRRRTSTSRRKASSLTLPISSAAAITDHTMAKTNHFSASPKYPSDSFFRPLMTRKIRGVKVGSTTCKVDRAPWLSSQKQRTARVCSRRVT